MKTDRQEKILQLVLENDIETQEEILAYLREHGYDVTQATVSRDIRHLQLVKIQTPDGHYRYAQRSRNLDKVAISNYHTIVANTVKNVDFANNLVVIKCFDGMANAACAALDAMEFQGVVGSLSGDDTILFIMRSESFAARLTEELRSTFFVS